MFTIQKFSNVDTFIFDIDGVMTDGKLYIGADGEYVRTSHMRDGYALQLAIKKGYTIIVISGAQSESYRSRLQNLGVTHVFMNVHDKVQKLKDLQAVQLCNPQSALYMGDDVPDVEIMRMCYMSSCPQNACDDVKIIAQYISPFLGGEGCVRDVIEKVLRSRDDWSI